MDKSFLVRLLGFPATLIHGDTLVLDRWLWVKRRLPVTRNGEALIDIGCGTGAFSIGAAKRGYRVLGLSWDARNQAEAAKRARLCGAVADFEVCDVRELGKHGEYASHYDVAICAETIEHILDDRKLVTDIARCLKPGGHLLLTTPYYYYRPITKGDAGPFPAIETGWHVRRGYTKSMLLELCHAGGLICEEVSYCSGFFSQKVTGLMRLCSQVHPLFGWLVALPLRGFVPLLDATLARFLNWPSYSICMVAQKPRFASKELTAGEPQAMQLP